MGTKQNDLERIQDLVNLGKMTAAQGNVEIVEIINGADLRAAEYLAARYALDGARAEYCLKDENIEARLDLLIEAGALFDWVEAYHYALSLRDDYISGAEIEEEDE